MSRKGPPSIFQIFCNIIDFEQSQRVPCFGFFGTMSLFNIAIFRLKLGFLSIYSPKIFPKLSETWTFYPNYIPFYQGGGGGSKSAPIWASTLYPKFETLHPATNWIFKKHKGSPGCNCLNILHVFVGYQANFP